MRLFLVRHAAHDNLGGFLAGRDPQVHLGPAGRAQARRLAEHLQRGKIERLQASPQPRTRETAQAIAERIGCPIELAPALDEIDFGHWASQTFENLQADPHWRDWNAARSLTATPSGETMLTVQMRMMTHILQLVEAQSCNAICMVSHADPIRAVIAYILGLSLDRLSLIDLMPASVTILDIDARSACLPVIGERVPDASREA